MRRCKGDHGAVLCAGKKLYENRKSGNGERITSVARSCPNFPASPMKKIRPITEKIWPVTKMMMRVNLL